MLTMVTDAPEPQMPPPEPEPATDSSTTPPPTDGEPTLTPMPVTAPSTDTRGHALTRDECTLDGRACTVGAGHVHRCASCCGRGWWRICTTHPKLDNCGCRGGGQHVTPCTRCAGQGGMIVCGAVNCRGFGSDARLSRRGAETPCPVCRGAGTRPARWIPPPIARGTEIPCGYCRTPQLVARAAVRPGDSTQPIEQFRRVDGAITRLDDPFACTECGHGWSGIDFARVVLL